MSNNLTRAIRRNVCAAIERFGGSVEAINDGHVLSADPEHSNTIFCHPGQLVVPQESAKIELDIREFRLQSFSNMHRLSLS